MVRKWSMEPAQKYIMLPKSGYSFLVQQTELVSYLSSHCFGTSGRNHYTPSLTPTLREKRGSGLCASSLGFHLSIGFPGFLLDREKGAIFHTRTSKKREKKKPLCETQLVFCAVVLAVVIPVSSQHLLPCTFISCCRPLNGPYSTPKLQQKTFSGHESTR
ncbi:hypothetical protein BGZ63DRAFT_383577 [Mariannaea sp. PMI_226]|nr:hypothetical protein BGZ63DRAFT_383577 [Mariannaea sp. PMI_226]